MVLPQALKFGLVIALISLSVLGFSLTPVDALNVGIQANNVAISVVCNSTVRYYTS